jgi:hypothetical protein
VRWSVSGSLHIKIQWNSETILLLYSRRTEEVLWQLGCQGEAIGQDNIGDQSGDCIGDPCQHCSSRWRSAATVLTWVSNTIWNRIVCIEAIPSPCTNIPNYLACYVVYWSPIHCLSLSTIIVNLFRTIQEKVDISYQPFVRSFFGKFLVIIFRRLIIPNLLQVL